MASASRNLGRLAAGRVEVGRVVGAPRWLRRSYSSVPEACSRTVGAIRAYTEVSMTLRWLSPYQVQRMIVVHCQSWQAEIQPSLRNLDHRDARACGYADLRKILVDYFPVRTRDGVGQDISIKHAYWPYQG